MEDVKHLDRGRLDLLITACREGPGLTMGALAVAAGVSHDILSPGYPWEPGAENVRKIACGAAWLLYEDAAALTAWLYGQEDPALEAFLGDLPYLFACLGPCRLWLPASLMILRLSRCRACHRQQNRSLVFQQRLAADPDLALYYAAVYAALPQVKKRDPELHRAIRTLRGQALPRPKIALQLERQAAARGQQVKIGPDHVLTRWLAAGLPLRRMFLSGAATRKKKGRRGRPQPAEAAAQVRAAVRSRGIQGLAGGRRHKVTLTPLARFSAAAEGAGEGGCP